MKETGVGVVHPRAIWSIDASQPFLTTLAKNLLDGTLIEGFRPADDPLLLSRATIYLPTRRAARALTGEFLGLIERDAAILPRILTIGDASEDGLDDSGMLDDLPVISDVERQLTLARLVLIWTNYLARESRELYGDEDIVIPSSKADAIRFAGMLCELMDQFETGEVVPERVFSLDVEDQAGWWSLTTVFFKIVFREWPGILGALGKSDPSSRRRELIDRRTSEIARRESGFGGPVIAAGSTGSIPATARFLAEIAKLENGAVVLPGVDFHMSDEAFASLLEPNGFLEEATMPTHPQFGIAKLLKALGATRSDIGKLPGAYPELVGSERDKLVSLSMLPSRFAQTWQEKQTAAHPQIGFDQVTLIEAKGERQEAAAIALVLREVLETPGKTAALVTPDRNLAKRVSLEMRRHGVELDDSGGEALSRSGHGRFVRLVLGVLEDSFDPAAPSINLASLMKHPLCRLGKSEAEADRLSRIAELVLLRGQVNRPRAGLLEEGLASIRLELQDDHRAPAPVKAMNDGNWEAIEGWCRRLDRVFQPLRNMFEDRRTAGFDEAMRTLHDVLTTLSESEDGEALVFGEEAGNALSSWFEQAVMPMEEPFAIAREDLLGAVEALLEPVSVRKPGSTHPRLHIYGPLEARLQQPDLLVLGGLNEGTWPQSATNDPFLNRPMKLRLELDPPERRVGLSAHDFQQFAAAPEVVFTRAERVENTPSVASRWLQKLTTVIGPETSKTIRSRGKRYLDLAEKLERAKPGTNDRWEEFVLEPAQAPLPVPPLDARPTQLPVTDIETLIRDPYALYAKRILKLRPLPPLEREADALLRGSIYHDVLADFQMQRDQWINQTNESGVARLMELLDLHLNENKVPEEAAIFWRHRMASVAELLVPWEHAQKEEIADVHVEIDGRIELGEPPFVLTARADRIDIHKDQTASIFDYKTGNNPSANMGRTLSPQLVLEGLIADCGGFNPIGKPVTKELAFIRLSKNDSLKVNSLSTKKETIEDLIASAEKKLLDLIGTYQDPERPYVSRYAVYMDKEMSGDYDHLARVREWSITDGTEGGDGGDADG